MDNKSIKWSLSIIVQIWCKNRHFSVCLAILLSTDARCLVIILGMQYNRPTIDFYRATLCMPSSYLSVRLSVCACVSVTLRYCVKTAKRRIMQIMPHDRPGTLVFKWDVLYCSCRISTDKCVAQSLCHSRASCTSRYATALPICHFVCRKSVFYQYQIG